MFFVAALVIAFVGVGVTGAAASGPPYSLYEVGSSIRVHLVDDGGARPDERCVLEGATEQRIVSTASGPPTQLGEGRPQFDYPRHRGPFRDGAGTPVLFACGDTVSVCFHPSTVVVDLQGQMTVTIEVTLFEGSGLVIPCDPANEVSRQAVDISGGTGPHCADPVVLTAPESRSSATVERLCASLRWVRPASAPLAISRLFCLSYYDQFGCDVTLTGGFGQLAIRWEVDGINEPAFDDQVSVSGRCPAGQVVDVRVSVSDSLAGAAERSARVRCH
jgi:hypothetical protein